MLWDQAGRRVPLWGLGLREQKPVVEFNQGKALSMTPGRTGKGFIHQQKLVRPQGSPMQSLLAQAVAQSCPEPAARVHKMSTLTGRNLFPTSIPRTHPILDALTLACACSTITRTPSLGAMADHCFAVHTQHRCSHPMPPACLWPFQCPTLCPLFRATRPPSRPLQDGFQESLGWFFLFCFLKINTYYVCKNVMCMSVGYMPWMLGCLWETRRGY